MRDPVIHVTDETFDALILKSTKPALVDFWAPWCRPCQAFGPIFEETAIHYQDQMIFAKMNVDDAQQTPAQYNVLGIPTIILFDNGEVSMTKTGTLSKSELSALIDRFLSK